MTQWTDRNRLVVIGAVKKVIAGTRSQFRRSEFLTLLNPRCTAHAVLLGPRSVHDCRGIIQLTEHCLSGSVPICISPLTTCRVVKYVPLTLLLPQYLRRIVRHGLTRRQEWSVFPKRGVWG